MIDADFFGFSKVPDALPELLLQSILESNLKIRVDAVTQRRVGYYGGFHTRSQETQSDTHG